MWHTQQLIPPILLIFILLEMILENMFADLFSYVSLIVSKDILQLVI